MRAAREADQQVVRSAVVVQRQRLPRQRVAPAHHAHVARLVEPRVVQVAVPPLRHEGREQLREVAHGEVGFAALHQAPRVAGGQGQHAQVDAGLAGLDARHQGRREERRGGVGHRQAELDLVAARVEVVRGQGLAQGGQRAAHLGPQGLGLRRGAHAVGHPHEQLGPHGFAQPAQRLAHRRLRHGQAGRGTRQAALGHHGVEDPQQVQIERSEVHRPARFAMIFI